jgi:hypothetical protein
MSHSPDPDNSGDVSYEDFEDMAWKDSSDLEPMDLDALDDEIEPVAEDEATEELLEVIDTLDEDMPPADAQPPAVSEPESPPEAQPEREEQVQPEASVEAPEPEREEESAPTAEPAEIQTAAAEVVAEPEAPAPVPESPASADKTSAEAATVSAPAGEAVGATGEPSPAPTPITYQVLLGLSPDLGARVLELRTTGEIADAPPPGVALTAGFTAADLPAVENVLAAWVRAHLPLQLETTGVVAEVAGEQQYVAAWSLDPEEELVEAQRELAGSLAALITLPPDTPTAFSARLSISDHVPARRFPHVIAQMQRDFETYVWHATELLLVQHAPEAAPGDWEVAKTLD